MKISGVYIAKNEGKNLARSLESVKEAVDELILVDTGSTDNTVEIFKSYGGKVFYQEWQDDFSAPRNLALSKATGDWLILLDADESFSSATRQNIRAVIEQAAPDTQGLLIRMINYDKDTGKAQDEFYALRIVRNIPGLNYQGRIHEMLHVGAEHLVAMQRVSGELLTIDHTGYTAKISQEKCRRNLALMQAAIAAGEPEERYYTYLYESYAGLGNMEQALHYGWLDVERGRQSITYATRSYRGLMSYYAKDSSQEGKNKRLLLVQKGVQDFPELPDFHAEYGECLAQLGQYQAASKELKLALTLYENYDGLEPCLLTDAVIPALEKRYQEIKQLAEKAGDSIISACAIVKNEAENIRHWLENVSVFADEIIINDTGSTDATKKIIANFSEENPDLSIILLESVWQDDFSLAKNQCLAEATGDWLVFTDADETFKQPESVRAYLGKLSANDVVQIVLVPMANIDKDDNNRIINIFSVPRIFRRVAGLHYQGRIHECITINGKSIDSLPTTTADNSLYMEHTGYSTSINAAKAQRNLNLLKKDIEEGQNIERLYLYLAECYYTLEDYPKALDNALRAIQSAYQPIGHQGEIYWLALNTMEKLTYPMDDRLAVTENALKLLPELPDFYARKGMLLTEKGAYREGIKCFEKATDLIHAEGQADSSSVMSVLQEVYADWGRCLYKTGRSGMAEEKYKEALSINLWTEKALCYWGDVYQGRLDKGFLQELSAIYDNLDNGREMLANIFAVNGFPELANYFSNGEFTSRINMKSYENIYQKSMEEIAEVLPSLYVCLLESYQEEYVNLLPEKLQAVVRYFHGKPMGAEAELSYEAYTSFLKEVQELGTTATVEKYLGLEAHINKGQEGKKNGN